MESFQPVRLAYNTIEPETGTDENLAPIIYLHGMSGVKEYWSDIPQILANATKRKSYTVDARNHGESEWSDGFSFDVNVDDLLHFMDTLGIQKAILVGHSMGGITAIHTALKKPDRVESIVVEDMMVQKIPKNILANFLPFVKLLRQALAKAPAGLNDEQIKKSIFQYVAANVPPQMAELMKRPEHFPRADIDIRFMKRDAEGRYSMKCNMDAIEKALLNTDALVSEPEGVFDGPAFFIYGTLSPFCVGKQEENIKQFFPKAILEGIEADHGVHVTNPEKFTETLLKFLS